MLSICFVNSSSAAPIPVSLRDVRLLEAQHLTPWLTANLHHLADALGISLQALPSKRVGAHRITDLLARDEDNGSLVLIENQLEAADDAHTGQILAYLAGSGASSLIWIARDFDARWLEVMKWLNAATRSQFCIFAVRIEVVRRGARDLVPQFQVLHAPQEWRAPPHPDPRRHVSTWLCGIVLGGACAMATQRGGDVVSGGFALQLARDAA